MLPTVYGDSTATIQLYTQLLTINNNTTQKQRKNSKHTNYITLLPFKCKYIIYNPIYSTNPTLSVDGLSSQIFELSVQGGEIWDPEQWPDFPVE